MARHFDLEEQEQIAQLKHFWSTWGALITWALIIVMGAVTAWNGYRYWKTRQAQQAVALMEAIEQGVQTKDVTRVQQALTDLRNDYPGTIQAGQGALLAARVFVTENRWDDAKGALRWLADNASDEGYVALAKLRLASVLMQEKAYDEALGLLSGGFPAEFAGVVADRRGDVYELQGKKQQAIDEYRRAWSALEEGIDYRNLIEAKLNALGAEVKSASGGAA